VGAEFILVATRSMSTLAASASAISGMAGGGVMGRAVAGAPILTGDISGFVSRGSLR
jgi:hypothetical protein